MRPQIQELVDHHLVEMIDSGPPADLAADFGLPVPSLVIALLLGVPSARPRALPAQHRRLDWTTRSSNEQKAQAFAAMYADIQELVNRKERDPGDDLISRPVTDYVATGQLTRGTAAMTA